MLVLIIYFQLETYTAVCIIIRACMYAGKACVQLSIYTVQVYMNVGGLQGSSLCREQLAMAHAVTATPNCSVQPAEGGAEAGPLRAHGNQ